MLCFVEVLRDLRAAKNMNKGSSSFIPFTGKGEASMKSLSSVSLYNDDARKLLAEHANPFLAVSKQLTKFSSVVVDDTCDTTVGMMSWSVRYAECYANDILKAFTLMLR
jgi:hypothetical protein